MAALLHSYPQPSSSMSMLQSRPSSASGILSTKPQNQINRHPSNNKIHTQRNSFNGINNGIPISNYSGQSFVASIAPYAFTSTPDLNLPGHCTISVKDTDPSDLQNSSRSSCKSDNENRMRFPIDPSFSKSSMGRSSNVQKSVLIDDLLPTSSGSNRPGSAVNNSSNGNPSLTHPATQLNNKSSPGRYRRTHSQSVDMSNSLGSSMPHLNNGELEPQSICQFRDFSLQMPQLSDFTLDKNKANLLEQASTKDPQKIRSKISQSSNTIHSNSNPIQLSSSSQSSQNKLKDSWKKAESHHSFNAPNRPYSSHRREESLESSNSGQSTSSKVSLSEREDNLKSTKKVPNHEIQGRSSSAENPMSRSEKSGSVSVPPRASSSDAVKRKISPSPLSKPVNINTDTPATKNSFASTVSTALQRPPSSTIPSSEDCKNNSPAAAQLTALKKKDVKKSKNFRLRRAFSFGSAAELRNASAGNRTGNNIGSDSTAGNLTNQEELDAEQLRIAQQQEAGGIGSGIYTGQGNIFSGSTDNLSISSTASSASIMIRKMGKGMKKSTRSIVGLFRPKHVTGASSDSANSMASEGHVSMVNVEAERGNTFKNIVDLPTEKSRAESLKTGKTSFLEINSEPSDRAGSHSSESSSAIRGIGEGDKERAESLTAAKKGILKRSGLGLENSLAVVTAFQIPQVVTGCDTPNSTAPSTPNDDQQGNSRIGSTTFSSDDYFTSGLRLHGSPKSHPPTPLSSNAKRNTTFSPRIQFHDTWPSGEYDRRGDIATCNRLTPMLAQQIKEELNSFKMEMEVHENSKIYTHFF